ncbi:MAG: hypothetical protein H0T89_33305 [Deltaproteobacteria bacterium]|nr:hypothetical protein [Deltaproteobacteria bacterium]MDQ3297976.1 hypothetical protein [Myxococcota bacterium]
MRLVGLVVMMFAVACGPPVARNVPQPNTAAAAGIAAGAAAAITLADPDGAAQRQESKKQQEDKRPQNVKATVPADVFDRLDARTAQPPSAQDPPPDAALDAAPGEP